MDKILLSIFLLLMSINLLAQEYNELLKIVAPDRASGDYLGYDVSISGNYAVIGAYQEDEDSMGSNTLSDAGSVYILKKEEGNNNWRLVKKIVASDRVALLRFGSSVSISGDYIIVGTPYGTSKTIDGQATILTGAAYIFKKNQGGVDNWGEVKKIAPLDGDINDEFGKSVSISGDYAIIGADSEDAEGGNSEFDAGAAYIFKKDAGGVDNWGEVRKLVASDRAGFDEFGGSVSISGDYAIIGADNEDENAIGEGFMSRSGSAYIFKKNQGGDDNWGEVSKIVASDRAENDRFGSSVSISGNFAIIGAIFEDEDRSGENTKLFAGSAYIFENNQGGDNSWGEIRKIVASNREKGDFFGSSVSICEDYALVGAYSSDENIVGIDTIINIGAAYLFKKNQGGNDNWGEVQKIVASDRTGGENFGNSVSISGNYALIGAFQENEDAIGANTQAFAGAAYIFQRSATSVEYIIEKKEIIIFPNPVWNELHVIGVTNETYFISDQLGKVILQGTFTSSAIDVTNLPIGVYNLRVKTQILRFIKY